MFSKVDNVRDFLFAFLEVEVFPKKGSTLKGKKIAPVGANYFFYEMTPITWVATMKMTVPSPESVPIRLKIQSGT